MYHFFFFRISLISLALTVAVVWSIKVQPWHFVRHTMKVVCNTAECKSRGSYYLRNQDKTVSPCDDFYQYACGNWEQYHPKPIYANEWSTFLVLRRRTQGQIREMLEQSGNNDSPETKAAKTLYNICANIPSLGKGDVEFVRQRMKGVYFPMSMSASRKSKAAKDIWMVDSHYIRLTGYSALFDYKLINDAARNNIPLLEIRHLLSPYGLFVNQVEWQRENLQSYVEFLSGLARAIIPKYLASSEEAILDAIDDVIELRKELEQIIYDTFQDITAYRVVSIKRFEKMIARTTLLGVSAIDWVQVVSSILGDESKVNESTIINSVNMEYMIKLHLLLERQPNPVVANHINLYFVERHLKLDDTMRNKLMGTIFLDNLPMGALRYEEERWQMCVSQHNMKDTLGRMYMEQYFDADDRNNTVRYMEEAKYIMKLQIDESTWLNNETKTLSKWKIGDVKVWAGCPEWYDDSAKNIRYTLQDIDPTMVRSTYLVHENRIVICAACLQPPVYSSALPYAINYGSVVFVLAHEMYHAFANLAMRLDTDVKASKAQWSDEMIRTYEEQINCFVQQYGQYPVTEMSNEDVTLYNNGVLTSDENVADTMGLKVAYQAYKRKLLEKKGQCMVLPGFEKENCDQLFFVAFANIHCGVMEPHYIRQYLQFASHSIPRIRVNGAVSNMEEFSNAFGCNKQQIMNPGARCDLWYSSVKPKKWWSWRKKKGARSSSLR